MPPIPRRDSRPPPRVACGGWLWIALAVGLAPGAVAGPPVAAGGRTDAAPRPVTVRVQWGGGKPQAWAGTIAVVADDSGADGAVKSRPLPCEWRTLSPEPDAAAIVREAAGSVVIQQPRPIASDGIDITIPDWPHARLRVHLKLAGSQQAATTLDLAVAGALATAVQRPLDGDGNRLTVRQAPGDALRVDTAGPEPAGAGTSVHRPGDRVRLTVAPLVVVGTPVPPLTLRMQVRTAGTTDGLPLEAVPLEPVAPGVEVAPGRQLVALRAVDTSLTLPDVEGVHEVLLEVIEQGSLRWNRPLATRTVQVVAVAPDPPAAGGSEWRVLYELDPGSPRLHERLRRLPGAALAHVPLPQMPLPRMSLPNVPLPTLPLPAMSVPSVGMPNLPLPKFSGRSLPPVTALVPTLGGLLASGDSRVEPHPLGPMLRLPPAAAGLSTWEGIAVPGVQPGLPHVLEVEVPPDQDAVLGVAVLEAGPGGAMVDVVAVAGFEFERQSAAGGPAPLALQRLVFWPATKHPLVVLSNPSSQRAALFGRVRILAGPNRLPAAGLSAGGFPDAPPGERRCRVHAFLPGPDLAVPGDDRGALAGARTGGDWGPRFAAVRHAAERFVAQGIAGCLVPVYARGAAVWPTRLTRQAPRWDPVAATDAALDPAPKDLLEVVCRVWERERLRLVPALAFDAPLAELEDLLAGGGAEAVGIVCVGRDGRPRRTAWGLHYNILDPRVQRAVTRFVTEVAGRLPRGTTVDGVALLLPHDGWLHLPGTPWGLDDATFARFCAAEGIAPPAPATAGERFATRAALVEGPLRDRWLAWRERVVADFYSRIADTLAARSPQWSLFVVPTTLFAGGELAARFRPTLGGGEAAAEVLREIGLDPALCTAHPRVVYVTPHVHAPLEGLGERSTITAANRSAARVRATAAGGRRGVALLEQPCLLAVDHVVPHGPFAGTPPPGPVPLVAPPAGAARDRGLAEALAELVPEVVFDMGLASPVPPEPAAGRRALEAVDRAALAPLASAAEPLVVRVCRGSTTVVQLVNPSREPCVALLELEGQASAAVDAADGSQVPLDVAGRAAVPLTAWGLRTVVLDGGVTVPSVRVEYPAAVRAAVAGRVEGLLRRRLALESPADLPVLDNPGFELGATEPAADRERRGVPGWELVELRRGTLAFVPAGGAGPGRAVAFTSAHGLSTLRSNPFAPPATGRISVAVRLRLREGDPQPPLRIAIEGLLDDQEYYRFAPIGGLPGGQRLGTDWGHFVLQVDDLPGRGLETLRVRFDLLGPGSVQIDDVHVFDLAFDERQRKELGREVARLQERLGAGDVGGCLVALDGHWPRFLEAFVADTSLPTTALNRSAPPGSPPQPQDRAGGLLDRMRRWWQ